VSTNGSAKDLPAASPSQVRLHRVTAALTDHVLALRLSRDEERHTLAAPNPVQVSCDGCLLAATAGRAVVAVGGAESDDQVRQMVSWAVPAESKPNYFANAGPPLLDVTPAHPDRMPLPVPYHRDRGLAFTERVVLGALLLGVAAAARADDWPQWLGPKRDGNWRETGLIEKFPEGGATIRWRAKVAAGYSGPAVAAGRVYVTDRVLAEGAKNHPEPFPQRPKEGIPGVERVLCFNEADGQ